MDDEIRKSRNQLVSEQRAEKKGFSMNNFTTFANSVSPGSLINWDNAEYKFQCDNKGDLWEIKREKTKKP